MHGFRLLWETVITRNPHNTIFGFDHEADVNAARLISRLSSTANLTEDQARQLGVFMHYALGATLGIVYKLTWHPHDSGAVFGVLLWLCADEIPMGVSGISDPFKKSTASHAGALAAHLVFGCVTAKAVRAMQSER